MHTSLARPRRRLLAGLVAGAFTILALAAPALAHVEAEGEQQPDGTTTVTFSFDHGCGESATTSLKIQLPAGATDVRPENPAGWTSQVSNGELTWTGGTVANGAKGEFVVVMKLTGTQGETVFMPTVQGCVQGENTWIDKSDDPEAEQAAPRITLTETVAGASTSVAPTTTAKVTPTTVASTSSSSSSNTGVIIAIVVAVIVIGGVVAFVVVRRRSDT